MLSTVTAANVTPAVDPLPPYDSATESQLTAPIGGDMSVSEPVSISEPLRVVGGNSVAVQFSPDAKGLAVWRAYLRGHATVTRALETDLLVEQRLSLAAYDVLVQLSEAPERRLRMTELAEAVLLSRSGVTRLVDRLERIGLVTRSRVREDGRGVAATLTERGLQRAHSASHAHDEGVMRHFTERLDETDLAALRRISQRLAD